MSEELLDALTREAGELVGNGRFDIDADKARDKLRLYQLADPRAWVVLVVEAAVLAGAERVEFSFDADDVIIHCPGVRLAAAELDNLLGALFIEVDRADAARLARMRARQQFAFAVNAALALEPRFISFVSGPTAAELASATAELASATAEGGDPPQGHRLELRPGEPDRLESIPTADDLRVHVKQRLRPGSVLDFFSALMGTLPEQRRLIEACRWSRVPIVIGREQISSEPRLEYVVARERIRVGGEGKGVAGIAGSDAPGVVHLLGAGVLIESLEPEWALPGFCAVVDSVALRRDISQTKLLRDASFEQAIDEVRRAHAKLIARVLDRPGPPWDGAQLWLEWLARAGGRELARYPELAAVEALGLWSTVLGDRCSVASLRAGPLPVRYLRAAQAPALDFQGARRFGDVVLASDVAEAALQACFVANTIEVGSAIALAREHAASGAGGEFARLGQPAEATLPGGSYVARVPLVCAGEPATLNVAGGELGLRSIGGGASWIRVVSLGRLLDVLDSDAAIPGLQAVIAGELEPDGRGGAARSEALGLGLLAVLRASERLLDAVAERERDRLSHHPLRTTHRRWLHMLAHPRGFLRSLRFEEDVIDACLAGFAAWDPLDATALERRAHAAIRTFSQVRGEPIAIADLIARRRADELIHWIDESVHSLPVLDREVLTLTASDVELLERVFGRENLAPYDQRVEWLRRREAFLAGPKRRGRMPGPADPIVELEGPGSLRGAFGLLDSVMDERARIDVVVHGRPIAEIRIMLGVPGLVGWVEAGDELELDEDLTGVRDSTLVVELAIAGTVALVERSLTANEPRRFVGLWRTIIRLALAGDHGLALLRALEGEADALARASAIVGLLEHTPRHVWEQAVELTLREGVAIGVAAVRERTRASSLRPDASELARARLRARLADSGWLARLWEQVASIDEGSLDEPFEAEVEAEREPESPEPPAIDADPLEPASAPLLPTSAPEDAWVSELLDGDSLRGCLWLGPEPPRIRLGRGDHVEVVLDGIDPGVGPNSPILPSLPIAAALRGPDAVLVDGRLPAPVRARLHERARALWSDLAERFATGESWIGADRAKLAAALVELLLRFPEPSERSAAADLALLERLVELRLFELTNGSRISAAVALRERPAELEHLELGARLASRPSNSAPPDPHAGGEAPRQADQADPRLWLIDTLRAELSLVRSGHDELLADAHLDSLVLRNVTLESGRQRRRPLFERRAQLVVIDSDHPLVVNLLATRDPILLSLLASATYSFLNTIHASVEDHHELRFAASHAAHVLSRSV